jgi:hypothetical protein
MVSWWYAGLGEPRPYHYKPLRPEHSDQKRGCRQATPFLFGPGGVIRTPDPYNPIVVRYQTALRPERAAILGRYAAHVNAAKTLPFKDLQNFLKFTAQLFDDLLTLLQILLCGFA